MFWRPIAKFTLQPASHTSCILLHTSMSWQAAAVPSLTCWLQGKAAPIQTLRFFPQIFFSLPHLRFRPEIRESLEMTQKIDTLAISYLVGGWAYPEKYEIVSWDDDIPNMMGKIIQMFQTTNQLFADIVIPCCIHWNHGKILHNSPSPCLDSLKNWRARNRFLRRGRP